MYPTSVYCDIETETLGAYATIAPAVKRARGTKMNAQHALCTHLCYQKSHGTNTRVVYYDHTISHSSIAQYSEDWRSQGWCAAVWFVTNTKAIRVLLNSTPHIPHRSGARSCFCHLQDQLPPMLLSSSMLPSCLWCQLHSTVLAV